MNAHGMEDCCTSLLTYFVNQMALDFVVFRDMSAGVECGAVSVARASTVTMRGVVFEKCSAVVAGGAVCLHEFAVAEIGASRFCDCEAASGGALLLMGNVRLTLRAVDMLRNCATSLHGGGMHADGSHNTILIYGGVFTQNTAVTGNGGMASLAASSRMVLLGPATVSRGLAASGAGVHAKQGSEIDLKHAVFRDGEAGGTGVLSWGGLGGAICLLDTSSLVASNSTFLNNAATHDGGALYQRDGSMILVKVQIVGNVAGGKGGGVALVQGTLTASNLSVVSNVAGGDGGGISLTVSAAPSVSTLLDCKVSNNTCRGNGGGIFLVGMLARKQSRSLVQVSWPAVFSKFCCEISFVPSLC